ncbi:M56 family metallopeptidase [Anaerorhabdus sp.]|uniref:M56 family metallopeptidase n=1 Tax=Anaerorhabdus sp. TaxID=1872524 RepID=UPI002B1F94F1|nr:M56 family metallopeptidase [Anaerorhabdus sp.]MEA4873996.1 M56 family metallopeptidase [Anaerorhabdus sp.]
MILHILYLILQFNVIACFVILIIGILQKKLYLFSVYQMMIVIKFIIIYLTVPVWMVLIYSFLQYNSSIIIPVQEMEDTNFIIEFSNNYLNLTTFSNLEYLFGLVIIIWVLGIVISIAKNVRDRKMIKQLIRISNEENEMLERCLREILIDLKVRKKVNIYLNHNIPSPCLIYLKRPTILIPNIYQTEVELQNYIYHELYHLKGNDLYFLAVIKFLQVIFWFNPIISWLDVYYSTYCEIACDSMILRNASDSEKVQYAVLLQKTLVHALDIKEKFTSLNFINRNKNEIIRRIEYMENYKKTRRNLLLSVVITVCLVLGLPITTFASSDYVNSQLGDLSNSEFAKNTETVNWNHESNEDLYPIEIVENPFIEENTARDSIIITRGFNSIDHEISANSSIELFSLSLSSSKAVSIQLSSGSSLSFSVLACKSGSTTCKKLNSVSNRINTDMTGFDSASYTFYIRNNSTSKSNQVRGFIEDYTK